MSSDLGPWRDRIDGLDRQIIGLLNDRMRCAQEIVRIKRETGLRVFDASREDALLNKLETLNQGPLPNEGLRRIYAAILSESRIYQALSSAGPDTGEANA